VTNWRLSRKKGGRMSNKAGKKLVAVVDDDPSIQGAFKKSLKLYDDIEVCVAKNAGEILKLISKKKLDLIILDLMMPYGDAKKSLNAETDLHNIDAGIRMLHRLRKNNKDIWVLVLTARNSPPAIREVRELLGQRGRLYFKPANTLEIENDLAVALGLESKVSPILLEANYRPLTSFKGGAYEPT